MRFHFCAILPAVLVTACASGGGKAETAPDPTRGLVVLDELSAQVTPISVAAGARLREIPSGPRIAFGYVSVKGKQQTTATDAVVKAYGYIVPPQRIQFNCQTRAVSPTKVVPVNCTIPEADIVYYFTEFRTARDSAYVGGRYIAPKVGEGQPESKPLCIVLALQSGQWTAVRDWKVQHDFDCGR